MLTGERWEAVRVNRTDRLYALVEELRARAPRPSPARALAERFEVSVRTIERDLGALMEAGVPIYATPGPGGGYAIDRRRTLPPVNFTPDEAMAVAVALARTHDVLFARRLRDALRKVVAAMADDDAERARALSERVRLLASRRAEGAPPPPAPSPLVESAVRVIEDAVLQERVVEIDYVDVQGLATTRAVEPVAVVARDDIWYLVGHCRLRDDGRAFRLDRVTAARPTDERSPPRDYESVMGGMPASVRLPFLE